MLGAWRGPIERREEVAKDLSVTQRRTVPKKLREGLWEEGRSQRKRS